MIRKFRSGEYPLYAQKIDPKTGKRRNLGTFKSRAPPPSSTSGRCSISRGIGQQINGLPPSLLID